MFAKEVGTSDPVPCHLAKATTADDSTLVDGMTGGTAFSHKKSLVAFLKGRPTLNEIEVPLQNDLPHLTRYWRLLVE